MIKAVITDFDGTLVDTFIANFRAYQQAFCECGLVLTAEHQATLTECLLISSKGIYQCAIEVGDNCFDHYKYLFNSSGVP